MDVAYYDDLFPERVPLIERIVRRRRCVARTADRLLAARDSLQLPARLSRRAHGARARQSLSRPRPRRSASALALARPADEALVLLPEAVRVAHARAADAGRVRHPRRGEHADALGGACAERGAAARHPVDRVRRELGPRVGKGVISKHLGTYVVQNDVMRDDLARLHGVDPARVVVTGWPQSDAFHARTAPEDFAELARHHGLDPARPVVLVMGNTPTNTPYEPLFFRRLIEWWEETGAGERFSLLFRPHPKDHRWQERFAPAMGRAGAAVQPADEIDLPTLATMLQHGACVVVERRHDPSRRSRQRQAGGMRRLRRGGAAGRDVGGEEHPRRPLPRADVVHGVLPRREFRRGDGRDRTCAEASRRALRRAAACRA